jgi:predicted  nucleic acid-binding Zn-ribbon protein
MKRQLLLLLDLQGVDTKMAKLGKRKEDLPGEIADLVAEVKAREEALRREEEELEDLQRRRRQQERELEAANETLRKYKRQLLDVKTNKEYTAMLHEIDGQTRKISDLEEEIISMLEEADARSGALREHRSTLQTDRVEIESTRAERERELGAIDGKVEELTRARDGLVKEIDGGMLATYERVRRGKKGVAVVAIDQPLCTGCFSTLPPQFFNEIKHSTKMHTCESCGRILVWRKDRNEEEGGAS